MYIPFLSNKVSVYDSKKLRAGLIVIIREYGLNLLELINGF